MEDKAFYFANGLKAENLQQLHDILRNTNEHITNHHLDHEKNDYAAWVRHVLQDETLARKIEKCRSVRQIVALLEDHLEPEETHEEQKEQTHHEHHSSHQRQEHAQEEPHTPTAHPHHLPEHDDDKSHLRDFVLGVLVGVLAIMIFFKLIGVI